MILMLDQSQTECAIGIDVGGTKVRRRTRLAP